MKVDINNQYFFARGYKFALKYTPSETFYVGRLAYL